jgi:hypothetical protein
MELPYVHDAALTKSELLTVVADIEAATEVLAVNVKQLRHAHSDQRPVTLRAALDQLLAGSITGVQIRYRYAGREFWDTLLCTQNAFRIVRIDHSATLSSA